MKKANRLVSLIVIVGLLAIVPASAQMDPIQDADEGNLGLLITINRLELTTVQMQQVHDILVGILDEANALKKSRETFEQAMLRFNGSGEELEAMLDAYTDQMKDKATSLRQNAEGAMKELKGILTVKQGEILQQSFMPMQDRMWGENADLMGMRDRRHTQGEPLPIQGRGRMGQQFGTQSEDEASGPITDRIRGFIAMHPEMREQMAQRLADKRLATLQQIVDILEAKLRYI